MPDIFGTNLADSIPGTDEDDLIAGGEGNDTIDGRAGNDELQGEDGNDLMFGGDGSDTLVGGTGDDDMFGGAGDDVLLGGEGNNLFNGGAGADTMTGGAGRDIFYNVTAGDVIDGGEGGDADFDRINLEGSIPEGGSYTITRDPDNRENGTVNYLDADANDAGRIVFSNIEKVVPCFTPGTRIATPRGEVAVEELKLGDRVITRDNGLQNIRWIGRVALTAKDLRDKAHLSPILIAKGALGNDLPERDMMVSPNHRMLVANDKTALYFEEREVLVAAKHLTGLAGVTVVDEIDVTYIHLMFDQHEVILSDGTWSESFQPGLQSLAGVGNAQRTELFELFPELATEAGIKSYASARRSVKAHEAALLVN
ncbi:Hint domain-containing protein [Sulfitobacter guttiformis]|nr:Hint domain-containing protein [Sulfitobacter guttiformis]